MPFGYITWIKIGIVLLLAVACYFFYSRWEAASLKNDLIKKDLKIVTDVNKHNNKVDKEKALRAEEERKATQKRLEEIKEEKAKTDALKDANHTAPDANTPAGPAWDAFGNRLRSTP